MARILEVCGSPLAQNSSLMCTRMISPTIRLETLGCSPNSEIWTRRHSKLTGDSFTRQAATMSAGTGVSPVSVNSLTLSGNSAPALFMAAAMLSTTGTFTTNSLENSMLRRVSFFSPPLRLRVDRENDSIGGLTQAMLMDDSGATLSTPLAPRVATKAMGRGTIEPASK